MMSLTSQCVLVGVDGSQTGALAVDFAAAEAQRRGRPLHLLHAYNRPVLYDPAGFTSYHLNVAVPLRDARRMVGQIADDVRSRYPGLPVSTAVIAGNPAGVLVAASADADLLVVGSRGAGGFSGLLLGSVAAQVSSHSAAPVVVVRESGTETVGDRTTPVVLGVDGSSENSAAVGFAFDEAAMRQAPLTALFAWSSPPLAVSLVEQLRFDPATGPEAADAVLTEALAPWREKYPSITVNPVLVNGTGAELPLIEMSRQACLLVVGSRGRGGFAGLLLGAVSRALIHHAHCPVAVVHADGHRT